MRKYRKKYHYLYKTTNVINEKYYIGIHSTYEIKDGYLGSGTKLWNSIYKYGKENFIKEELEFFESREELLQREREIVNEQLLQDPLCMNLKIGGEGGICSEEHHLKMRRGASNFAKNQWKDPIFKEKMRILKSEKYKKLHSENKLKHDTFTGKKHTFETKRKIGNKNSIQQKGEKNSQFGTCWIKKENEIKKIKLENLQKMLDQGWIRGRK